MLMLRRAWILLPTSIMAILGACGDDGPAGTLPSPDAAASATTATDSGSGPATDAGVDARAPVHSMLSVGAAFACVLAKDRTVSCWGRNDVGQLGRDPASTPPCGGFPCATSGTMVDGLANVEHLAAGDDFACALDRDASVWCWGSNTKGQLGTETTLTSSYRPRKVIVDVAALSAGGAHACAITNDGFLRCWGENNCATLSKTGSAVQSLPLQMQGLPQVVQAAVGPDQICAVKPDAKVLCWGADHRGSLGHDLDPSAPKSAGFPYDAVPKHVQAKTTEIPIDQVSDVHVGSGVACARRTDGSVHCWGDNERGALGQGIAETTRHARSLEVPALRAVKLDVHGQTACVVVAERLLCWGDAQTGKLETGDAGCGGCRPLAYAIPDMTPVRDVFSGPGSLATIKSDLTVWMWGRNASAELAVAPSAPLRTPRQITSAPVID